MPTALARWRVSVLVIAVGLVTGCMMDTTRDQIDIIKPAVTAIPSGTKDPRATAAVSTYQAFVRTVNNAQQYPVSTAAGSYPEASDFTRYSIEPVRAQYEAFIEILVKKHHAFRGTQPKSNVTVTSIDLGAQPHPVVTLADCQTGQQQWRAYDTRNNTVNPQLMPGAAAPYGITIQVIFLRQRWYVQTIRPDTAGRCAD